MYNNIPWNIIIKSIQNQADNNELAELDIWLKKDKENRKTFSEVFNIYSVTSKMPEPLSPNMQEAWKRIESYIKEESPVIELFKKYKYIAASVAILIISVTSIWYSNNRNVQILDNYTEIFAPPGQKTKVVLPDSSLVWLNSGSSLKYKGDFNVKERKVILEGEAFFDVRKNKSKLFRVETGILYVNVHGTSFNIKNYENDTIQEITVSEGKVGIYDISKEIRQIAGGQQAMLNKNNNKISFSKSDPEVVSAWKNNELIFDNTPIGEAMKYLERWYGVNIKLDNSISEKHNYTFKIKTESFIEMLEKMKLMTPLTYEINGEDVLLKYTD